MYNENENENVQKRENFLGENIDYFNKVADGFFFCSCKTQYTTYRRKLQIFFRKNFGKTYVGKRMRASFFFVECQRHIILFEGLVYN